MIVEWTVKNKRTSCSGLTDKGIITFQSAEFVQKLLEDPVLSESQDLKR